MCPYIVKKVLGTRKYKIINQKTGEVVGSSVTLDNAHKSINYRMEAEAKPKPYDSFHS